MLKGEGEARAMGAGLAIDGEPLGATPLQPLQAAPVHLGILTGCHNDVVQHRPLGHRGQLFQEGQVGFDIPRRLGDLDKAVVAFVQHLGQVENVLVAHDVGDHGRAVIVGLGRVRPQPLNGKAAQAGVHALVGKIFWGMVT